MISTQIRSTKNTMHKKHNSKSNSSEYVKHIKCDAIKSNIQCTIKFKIFNKALKSHNRNRWLIPSKSIGYSFIHDDSNYFSLII